MVIDNNDPSNVSGIELDPSWVYHFGNAYEISPTEIGFALTLHDDPGFRTKDAFAAIDGSWDHAATAASRYVQARIDLKTMTARLERAPEFGQVESLQTDARENLPSPANPVAL